MIIRKQLWLSNFITIIATIILLIIVSMLISRNYQNISGFGFPPRKLEREAPDLLKRELSIATRFANNVIKERPIALQNIKYIEQMDSFINESNTSMIVRKNSEILYYSSFLTNIGIKSEDIIGKIDSFPEKKTIEYNKNIYMEKISFRFPDQSKGDVLIISDITSTLKDITQFRYSVFFILVFFLIAIIIISIIMTYVLSRNIVKPLNQLKNAAMQIRKGNFSFKINTDRKDEIGDLSRTFEEARKQLAETEKIKKKFEDNRNELISNISHDLKTPITTIKGYVEGIIDGIPGSKEKMDKYLKTIYQNAVNMEYLINELFLLSEFELKELPQNFAPVNIKTYLVDCFEELKFYLAEKGIVLNFDTDYTESDLVYIDQEKIKRVILNIINNAVNHKKDNNPTITIRLTEKEKVAQIEIHDNGKGIPGYALENIFERFYKADKARSMNSSGTGLGLYIAKKIILSHEGQIWVKSQEGKGTSIYFTLKKIHFFSKRLKSGEKNEKSTDY